MVSTSEVSGGGQCAAGASLKIRTDAGFLPENRQLLSRCSITLRCLGVRKVPRGRCYRCSECEEEEERSEDRAVDAEDAASPITSMINVMRSVSRLQYEIA